MENFHIKTGTSKDTEKVQGDYVEAQKWCNFVLHKPTWLPHDATILQQSLRAEQKDISSSYRMLLSGENRSLSIKQFLFDFAPPAYDHPALWRNPEKTDKDEFPVPQAYPINEHILWIGRDHRRFFAATVGFQRVRIEATVQEGVFTVQELVKIFENLVPVDKHYAEIIRNTPFAVLAYQSRYEQTASPVPLSYWTHKRNPTDSYHARTASQDNLAHLPLLPPSLIDVGYTLDSFFVMRSDDTHLSEIDFMYEQKERGGAYLRLLVTPPDSLSPIQYPPKKYTQRCRTKYLTVGGNEIQLAWLSEYGGFEAVFPYKGGQAMLLAQPKTWTNEIWFKLLLDHLLTN